MSGFGQNPPGASAFTFPSLNQPGAATTASGFTFGAPKTAVPAATPASAAPSFGTAPSLGMKTSIGLTGTTASASIPIGIPQSTASGTLFGTTWTGVFSPGSNAETTSIAASIPSVAPAAATIAKSSPFTFGTSVSGTTTQLPAMPQAVPTAAPTLPGVAPQAGTNPASSLAFSFGPMMTTNTTFAPPSAPTLSLPTFGAAPKPQMTTSSSTPLASIPVASTPVASTPLASTPLASTPLASTPVASMPVASTPVASTPLASMPVASTPVASTAVASAPVSTAIKFSVSASTPLSTTTKTTTINSGMAMFSTPVTSAAPVTTSVVPAISTAVTSTTVALTSAANVSGVTAAATEEDIMTYSKLQENINKWAMELEKQEKIFLHQATEMNGWDRVIVENSEKLHMLNGKIEKVRREQRHLDLELDFVLSQQNELDYMLKGLEKEWGSVPPSDPERQHTYKIAESLDYKLKLMSEDLKEVVDHMNAMNYPPNDEFNPVMQIVRILNAHMNVLLMVERKTNLAETKVKEVGKLLELCKRDYDRACHLYFD